MSEAFERGQFEAIKWLAFVAMVADHVNTILLAGAVPALFQVGRFALPVFAVTFGIGLARSADPLAVASRLVLPAIVAQAAWEISGHGGRLNILGVFSLAALAVGAWRIHYLAGAAAAGLLVVWSGYFEGEWPALGLVAAGLAARALPSSWPHIAAGAVWLFFVPALGTLGGLVAPHVASRLKFALPRVPGLLAWGYPVHLALLAALNFDLHRP